MRVLGSSSMTPSVSAASSASMYAAYSPCLPETKTSDHCQAWVSSSLKPFVEDSSALTEESVAKLRGCLFLHRRAGSVMEDAETQEGDENQEEPAKSLRVSV